jgi:hypothetical protein
MVLLEHPEAAQGGVGLASGSAIRGTRAGATAHSGEQHGRGRKPPAAHKPDGPGKGAVQQEGV